MNRIDPPRRGADGQRRASVGRGCAAAMWGARRWIAWTVLVAAACSRSATPTDESKAPSLPLVVRVDKGYLAASVARATESAAVGESILLELTAEGPAPFDATLPADAAFSPFEVLSRSRVERSTLADGRVATRARVTIASYRAGELELPKLPFTFATPASTTGASHGATDGATGHDDPAVDEGATSSGDATTLETPPVPFTLSSLIASQPDEPFDPAAFIGPRPHAPRDAERRAWLLPALVGGGVLAALGATTAILMSRRRRGALEPSPAAWAHRELDRLVAERLPEQGEMEPFFVRITGVLREFLRRQLGVAAPARTSEEFLRELGSDGRFTDSQRAHLDRVLRLGDLVKFARESADVAACDDATLAVRRLVDDLTAPIAHSGPIAPIPRPAASPAPSTR
ncbi:MAG: hypothetical protein U0575_12750 [Phycisphaerales bacterium]